DTLLTISAATCSALTVNVATASTVVFGQQPTTTTAGNAISPAVTVKVEDTFGNVVTTDTSNVVMTLAAGPGPLSNSPVTVAAIEGGSASCRESVERAGGGGRSNDAQNDTSYA